MERKGYGVVRRIFREMGRQHVSHVQLAARLRDVNPGRGWTDEMTAMRLGELMPLTRPSQRPGGRVPLTGTEIEDIAAALNVSPLVLIVDAHEHVHVVDPPVPAEDLLALACAS
jgi:hypothetical protein